MPSFKDSKEEEQNSMIHYATGEIAALKAELSQAHEIVRQKNAELGRAYAKIEEQQRELAKFAGNYLDSMRAEGDLTEEVKRLRIKLDQENLKRKLERAELGNEIEIQNLREDARWKKFFSEYQLAFLKMGFDKTDDGFLKEAADFVKANPGKIESTARARKALRIYMDYIVMWSEQAILRLKPNERGASWIAKSEYWGKRYDLLADMEPFQLELWNKFRVLVNWYASRNHCAMVAHQSVILSVRACLSAIESNSASSVLLPTLQSAEYALSVAKSEEKYLSLIGDSCQKLCLDVESGLAEVSRKREDVRQTEEDQKETAGRAKRPCEATALVCESDDVDDYTGSPNTRLQTSESHVEDTIWHSDDDCFDLFPKFNPANGLPMNGVWDVHGNVYGTNFNDQNF